MQPRPIKGLPFRETISCLQDPHILRVRRLLMIGVCVLTLLGCAWGIYDLLHAHWGMLAMHFILIGFGGVLAGLIYSGRVRFAAIMMVHGLLVIISVFAFFDMPGNGLPRSVHMFFLPVAAAATLVFRKDILYLRVVLPLILLACCLIFGPAQIGMMHHDLTPSPEVLSVRLWINYATALLALGIALLVMQTDITVRHALFTDMRKALADGQFDLHYQPQVNVQGQVFGAEALLRWRHPSRGVIAPGEFITVAEETGLIQPIGAWVLKKACEQLVKWSENPATSHLTISVNVSASQLRQPDFVQEVSEIVSRSGAPHSRLKLELTESILASDVEATIEKMVALRSTGMRWALDDFGTGYSSLKYLKHLPFDQLKIDRSFVNDLLTNSSDKAIVKTLVALSRNLNMMLIAEGVETNEQLDVLLQKGCRHYQGYLFSRPLPLSEFEAFLSSYPDSVAYAGLKARMSVA
jgi:EAL domain-containing protein (putative c-di-GMP-specific phosphodiesterase class I)